MASTLATLVVASLLATTNALPPAVFGNNGAGGAKPGTVSLTQVHNTNFIRNGALELARILRKYNAPIRPHLQEAVSRIRAEQQQQQNQKRDDGEDDDHKGGGGTGTAEASPQKHDVEYLIPVSIGSPGQTLSLDLDTGSSDLWVFSTLMGKDEVNGQAVYNPEESRSAKKMEGYSWKIQYGDGSTSSGDVYQDTVTVGGLTVSSQAVEAARNVSDEFTADTANDGLIGLAFGSINTILPKQQHTWFENAMSQLDQPVFTADLKASSPGHYNFGYIDSSAYKGNITYTAVDSSDGFWMWDSPGYAVGSTSSGLNATVIHGIADTGTTLLLLPEEVVGAYYSQVDGGGYSPSQGGYTVPCDVKAPSLYFAVSSSSSSGGGGGGGGGGREGEDDAALADATFIKIPGKYMVYSPVDKTGKECFGGVQEDTGIGFSIFGDVALKAAFVVFDAGNLRLGWAEKELS
ncbi:putative endothiapepsin precursor [Podospora australis]|uniref:Endothiapepsin n=1 Tax=Podospora australis TaxID=1536484 RepID=A0AAN6WUU1_9PEZI|nr:putative endothiapepsin precursor [Podospora australis]